MSFLHPPYVLTLASGGTFKKQRAIFEHGMYWLREDHHLIPLRKEQMCRSAYELTELNRYAGGIKPEKTWVPLSEEMLAWFDMLPDSKTEED